MGLEFATCYSIIEKHGGFMTVESERGVGSSFNIYLPASRREDFLEKAVKGEGIATKGRTLVTDDEETVLDWTGIVFNYLGYDVENAENGDQAIDLYKTAMEMGYSFYAGIMDLNIPGGMGDKEAMWELLAIDPHVKVVMA